jgi:predicted DCC family thiol-disulfide oxidoreductase YuxK
MSTLNPIILFDGVCNLCNGAVNFIVDRDPEARFRLAALQSEVGESILREHQLSTVDFDSIVLVEGDAIFSRSTAALRISKNLIGGWPLLYTLIVVPRWFRDWVYNWISRNRYRWFGKQQNCRIPTPELRSRFLHD